jgi:glycosyltransferase involved in cell wall biosynthesis
MSKLIKVYSLLGKHPIYESIVKYPPKNIHFINAPSVKEFERLSVYRPTYMKIKNFILNFIYKLKVPRMFFLVTSKQYDIIHSSRGVLILNRKPWVIDFEHIGSFGTFTSERVKKVSLKLLSSNFCKKILPHCEAAQKSFLNAWKVDGFIKDKFEVLYPAIEARKIVKKKKDKITIGFIATRGAFYEKGGREVVEAFRILSKKFDKLELVMKVSPPLEIVKRIKNMENVIFIEKHFSSREELFKNFYEKLDIFVLPTYVDSFGYSILEAMSVGLPIVATNIFAIPEIVEDTKNGFLINSPVSDFRMDFVPEFFDRNWLKNHLVKPVIKQLVEKLSLLIEDSSLRNKMGRYNRMLIEKGKFSIKQRNEKLRRIYEEAIKR